MSLRSIKEEEHKKTKPTMAVLDYLYNQGMSLDAEVEPVTGYARPGRPGPATPTTIWRAGGTVRVDEEQLEALRAPLGRYIIATDELDPQRLLIAELLTVYKDQNRPVERGFRFLKDPLFFASSFFLKKPAHIMALLMVMGLSLPVYALAEHRLRAQLTARDGPLPHQTGKPTWQPTMRRVFQMFEGIDLLLIQPSHTRHILALNLQEIHLYILTLFGPPVQGFYLFPPWGCEM